MSDGFEIVAQSGDDSFDVTLPVTRAEFADFLGRVIGGKDKLDYSFPGDVHISSALLSGIEAALVERVESQNGGRLVSSRYAVRFNNGRGFKTSNLESLLNLSPRGEACTEFISIELIFLINYPGVGTPAREKISLAFAANYSPAREDSILAKKSILERARCEIEYYNRVFAEDCLNTVVALVQGQTSIPKDASYIKSAQRFLGDDGLPVLTFFVAGLVYCLTVYQAGAYLTDWMPSVADKAALTLEQKVNLIVDRSTPYMVATFTSVFLLVGILCSLIPALIIGTLAPELRVGRITFGVYENDLALISRLAQKKTRRTIRAISGILFSIVVSIVGAYLYDKIMGRL